MEAKLTFLNIVINGTLFVLKFVAGIASGSMAIIADAVNSLLDAIYGLGVSVSIVKSHESADKGHPFHRGRAEPMVGMGVAMLTAVAAFVFLQSALFSLFAPSKAPILNWLIAGSLIISVIGKLLLGHKTHLAGKTQGNIAMLSTAADSRADILITMIALAGVVFASTGAPWVDNVATLIIAGFLFKEAYKMGQRNMEYVTGTAPPKGQLKKIRELASHVRGVRGIHHITTHYVHNYVHVQMVIGVNGTISAKAANAIAHHVQHEVEQLPSVSKAFIAIEPA